MKHLFLLLALAACLPAGAAINDTGKKAKLLPFFLNSELTLNHEPKLYTYDDVSDDYLTEVTIFDGEFNQTSKFTIPYYPEVTAEYIQNDEYLEQESASPLPARIYHEVEGGFKNEGFEISQTLFNNDANFEWIVPIIEAVDCSYTTEYEKVEGKKLFTTGYRVESQNGSVVATVKFPNGLYEDDGYGLHLYMINGKKYLVICLKNIDYTERYYLVYEIDTASSSINAVGAPRRVSVAPTTPTRGTDVNINLGNPAEIACKVIVTSISGRTVMTRNIEPGKTSTTINTANFEKGVYIVTVSDGKTTRENTKIVVR